MGTSEFIVERKRLGQFFSGAAVGRLLAALADARAADSIIDPTAGSGDLLQSCLDIGARPSVMAGIEIEATAHRAASRRLPDAHLIRGDAFDQSTLARLPKASWDLVIGNPPFVRYQDTAKSDGLMTNATTTRNHLIGALESLGAPEGKKLNPLLHAARTYSGQADLAVPACLLSMALVNEGGRLALVLPATFLSRAYAEPLRDCLNKLFVVERVVEDASSSWFPDALVRTMLIVARRGQGKSTAVNLSLGPRAASISSLVGAIYPDEPQPEAAFAKAVGRGVIPNVTVGPFALADSYPIGEQDSLQSLGVEIGQGLRTGANDFFYVKPLSNGRVRTSRAFGEDVVRVPSRLLRPALRDQSTLAEGENAWAVLDLRTVALPEDIARAGATNAPYAEMPSELAEHVRRAALTLSGKPGRQLPIPRLSAVQSNVRAARFDRPARFWYMLPDFQSRHLPDIVLPRVIHDRPHAHLMARPGELADANITTIRATATIPAAALVAILNSAWFWHELERRGTVLGGGALKVESAVVKETRFPALTPDMIKGLSRIGATKSRERNNGPWLEADEILLKNEELIQEISAAAQQRMQGRRRVAIKPER